MLQLVDKVHGRGNACGNDPALTLLYLTIYQAGL